VWTVKCGVWRLYSVSDEKELFAKKIRWIFAKK
jgi:hypothetical protein